MSLAGKPEPLPQLLSAVYEAALDQDRWQEVLPRILRFAGAPRGLLGFASTPHRKFDALLTSELDLDLLARLREEFHGEDPIITRGVLPPVGSVFQNVWYVPRSDYHAMEVYRACYGPGGTEKHLVVILDNDRGAGGFLGAYRAEWEPEFSGEDFERLQSIAPHILRAVAICRKLGEWASLREADAAALSMLPFAVCALNAEGRVVSANAAAEALFRADDGLTVRGGSLSARGRGNSSLDLAIRGARETAWARSPVGSSVLTVQRPSGRRPYQVSVTPVAERPSSRLFGHSPSQAVVLVVISDPEAAPKPAADSLRQLFGLTPTLALLAVAIAGGKTVKEFADDHAVTEGTARIYLKELMRRVGVRRQAELVRALLTSVAQLST